MIIDIKLDTSKYFNKRNLIKKLDELNIEINKDIERTKELDEYFCSTPSVAFDYLSKLIADRVWVRGRNTDGESWHYRIKNRKDLKLNRDLEKIFVKSNTHALNYLRLTGLKSFSDPELDKRIKNKILNKPELAFYYAKHIIKKRLTKEQEKVFLKDYRCLYHYAKLVIRGNFDEEIQKRLILATFSDTYKQADPKSKRNRYNYSQIDYLKDYMENVGPLYSGDECVDFYFLRKLNRCGY